MSTQIEKLLCDLPEVKTVFCKTGRPEIANDVMGVHQTDVWVILKHHDEWPEGKTREELIEEMSKLLNDNVPGVIFGFTQPIEMRVDELVAGVKADVAVLLYGDDLEVLNKKAGQIEQVLKKIPGAADVKADYQANLTTLRIEPRPEQLALYGIDASRVMDVGKFPGRASTSGRCSMGPGGFRSWSASRNPGGKTCICWNSFPCSKRATNRCR